MTPGSLTATEALRQLAESTEQLRRAALAGDFPTVRHVLERRAGLVAAFKTTTLDSQELQHLEAVLHLGREVQQILTARRETMRAEVASLEAGRRRLRAWSPAADPAGRDAGWHG